VPLLEGSNVHLRLQVRFEVAAGDCGQVLPELDAEDPVAGAGEGHGGPARAAPDLEYPSARRYPGERDYVVEEFLRITGPHLLVAHAASSKVALRLFLSVDTTAG